MAFYLKKKLIHLTKEYVLPSLVETCLVILKKIFKYFQCNFTILQISPPLEKGMALHLNKLEVPPPSTLGCFVQCLI